jgi:hypothetical protein
MERLWEKLLECYLENPKAIKEIVILLLIPYRKPPFKRKRTTKSASKQPGTTRSSSKRGRAATWRRSNPS